MSMSECSVAMKDDELERLVDRVSQVPAERVQALQRLLGEAACRQIGIYPIPDEFLLSVVIPVYNERQWIREMPRGAVTTFTKTVCNGMCATLRDPRASRSRCLPTRSGTVSQPIYWKMAMTFAPCRN